MKNEIRYVIVLSLICALSAGILTMVYNITKGPIAASRLNETMNAIKAVLPEDVELKYDASMSEKPLPRLYPALRDGKLVGAAVEADDPGGYGGNIRVMVGVLYDPPSDAPKVHAVQLLQHQETPGLGTKAGDPPFLGQFAGLSIPAAGVSLSAEGGTINSITGVTMSSRAVTSAVNRAVRAFKEGAENLRTTTGGQDG